MTVKLSLLLLAVLMIGCGPSIETGDGCSGYINDLDCPCQDTVLVTTDYTCRADQELEVMSQFKHYVTIVCRCKK